MTPKNPSTSDSLFILQKKEKYGTIPEHLIISTEKVLHWKIYIDEPGEKLVDVSYSFQNKKSNSFIEIKAAGEVLNQQIENTGKTVGEPNSDWVIDNYKAKRLGKILFPKRGIYDLEMKISPGNNEEVNFQWIWLK